MAIGMYVTDTNISLAMAVFDTHEDRDALRNDLLENYIVIGDTLPGSRGVSAHILDRTEFRSQYLFITNNVYNQFVPLIQR